jgi:hypothetical protein
MMRLKVGRWGIGMVLGGVVVDLFLGDVFVRVPGVGELAWNQTGFYLDREVKPSISGQGAV